MKIEAIESVFVAVPDLEACAPYERLGLRLSRESGGRADLLVGGPANQFAVHFLADADGPLARARQAAIDSGRPLFAVGLVVADLDGALGELASKGIHGERFGDSAWLPLHDRAGTDVVLTRQVRSWQDRPDHSFPLLRLDHLAAVTPDLDEKARFWAEVLGVPTTGEVITPTLIIRQLRIGDATMELLAPATPDSPIAKRQPGLVSMASWEVTDLGASFEQARAARFAVSEPAAGPLPGTRIATVDGAGLAGVNMQLLEYVR